MDQPQHLAAKAERLVVTDLQSGRVQPVDHTTARERIEKHIRDRHTR